MLAGHGVGWWPGGGFIGVSARVWCLFYSDCLGTWEMITSFFFLIK